ncbi:MAG: DinB family protein [bacterium]
MDHDGELRRQLANLLQKRQAHMSFEDAVADFPPAHFNTRPDNLPYTFWHLLEHLRVCQDDILDYIRDPHYEAPNFPDDLWPARDAQTDRAGWERTMARFLADRRALVDLVNDPETDLFAPIPHGWDGHNVLREILIVAEHNAYHVGEFAALRGAMDLW